MEGLIYNIEKFTTTSGPGFRTAIYLKGCPLSCAWCDTPVGQKEDFEMLFDRNKCIFCYNCATACQRRVVADEHKTVFECVKCGQCADVCPTGARSICGYTVQPDELFKIIEPELTFYEGSGGGVTFTGGEPLLQPDFLMDMFKLIKNTKATIAVDTSGMMDYQFIEPLVEYIDYFLYDIKFASSDLHTKYTGVGNEMILDNFKRLASRRDTQVVVRIPLIKNVNTSLEEISSIGKILKGKRLRKVQLIPYHDTGNELYKQLGKPLDTPDFMAPTKREMIRIKNLLLKYTKNVEILDIQ